MFLTFESRVLISNRHPRSVDVTVRVLITALLLVVVKLVAAAVCEPPQPELERLREPCLQGLSWKALLGREGVTRELREH